MRPAIAFDGDDDARRPDDGDVLRLPHHVRVQKCADICLIVCVRNRPLADRDNPIDALGPGRLGGLQ
jgi:hypothetical protein